ncbi:alpha/beta hydrolase [Mycetocola sp.]|uniref:alpha/beta hydrolase n=1 Tax=Mycetocola sp. TaxID=1871042 RepID=UPI003989512A
MSLWGVARGTVSHRIAPILRAFGGAATALAVGTAALGMLPDPGASDAPSALVATEQVPSTGTDFAVQFGGRVSAAAEILATLPAAQVAALWTDLPRHFAGELIEERPDVIGNLEGASYADRDRANIRRLATVQRDAVAAEQLALSQLRSPSLRNASALTVAEASARVEAIDVLLGLFSDAPSNDARRYLLSLDASVDGPPLAAISVGNPDTALYTTYFVPGMNSSVLQAEDYLRGVTRIQQASAASAAVLWLGYESPGPVETVSTARAEAGAVLLGAALDGYDAYRNAVGLDSELTVLAHSYGSTTAAIALAGADYSVSSFVMIGSAGVPSHIRVGDLQVPAGRVYASEATADGLAAKGQFWSGRTNPASVEWGAQLFSSNGTTLADGTILAAVQAHDVVGADHEADSEKYLGDGTESLYGIRKIVTGQQYDVAPVAPPSTGSTILASAAK